MTGTEPSRIRPGLCFIPLCGHKKHRNALLRAANTPKPHSKGLQKDSILWGACGWALWPETTAPRAPSWQVAGCVWPRRTEFPSLFGQEVAQGCSRLSCWLRQCPTALPWLRAGLQAWRKPRQRLDAELPSDGEHVAPLVSRPAGWNSSAAPKPRPAPRCPLLHACPGTVLAPHVPVSHLLSPAGPGPQDSSPRVTRGSRGPSSRPPCISTQGEEIWLYFHSQGARSLAAGPSAAPAQPCAPVLPLQKHADNNQKEAERERKSETTALPPCSCTEQSPNEKNMAAS